MNRNLAKEVVGCLRVSGSPETSVERLYGFGAGAWKRTLEWLDHSGLALLAWHRLKELGARDAVPPEVGAGLERNLTDHRARVAETAEEFDSINRCLAGAGVSYAALKGFALIPEYCPDASLRTTYDHDYLLAPESRERAERALKAAGYVRKHEEVDDPVVYFHAAGPPRSPLCRDDLYSAKFPRTVELHYRFWDPDELKISFRLPEDPLARLRLRSLGPGRLGLPASSRFERGLQFHALCEQDELVFQVLHAFRHILQNWCRLCSLLDIASFIEHRSADAWFWARFLDGLSDREPLSEIVGIIFSLAASLFGAALPDAVAARTTRRLRSSVALWLRCYGQDLALNNFSDNKFSLFLHREFIQDPATWREIERGRLFPWHRPNRAAETSNPKSLPRLAAAWKQGVYTARRLRHHLLGAARYGLESHRWERARAEGR
jgi:hypothetical protein